MENFAPLHALPTPPFGLKQLRAADRRRAPPPSTHQPHLLLPNQQERFSFARSSRRYHAEESRPVTGYLETELDDEELNARRRSARLGWEAVERLLGVRLSTWSTLSGSAYGEEEENAEMDGNHASQVGLSRVDEEHEVASAGSMNDQQWINSSPKRIYTSGYNNYTLNTHPLELPNSINQGQDGTWSQLRGSGLVNPSTRQYANAQARRWDDEAPPPSPKSYSTGMNRRSRSLDASMWTSASDSPEDSGDSMEEEESGPSYRQHFVPKKITFPSAPRRASSATAGMAAGRAPLLTVTSPTSATRNPLDTLEEVRLDSHHSDDSSESSNHDSDIIFRGSKSFSNDSASTASIKSQKLEEQQSEGEKQRRLAEFLAETAAAMEGGKSLSMVHPTTDAKSSDNPKTLAELAASSPYVRQNRNSFNAAASTSLQPTSSPVDRRASSDSTSLLPSANTQSSVDRRESVASVASVYYTPRGKSANLSDIAEFPFSKGIPEESGEGDAATPAVVEPEGPPSGLGLRIEPSPVLGGQSPATLKATSPVLASESANVSEEMLVISNQLQPPEVQAKMLEKRRRGIEELLETEAIYASDMAVVRDIYIARARGADLATVADHVMRIGLGLGQNDFPPNAAAPRMDTPPGTRRPSMRHQPSSSESRAPSTDGGEPLMSSKDMYEIFGNLEDIAGFAEGFSGLLDTAFAEGAEGGAEDRVGEVFLDQLPRIQQLYSTYCARHHRAIVRLQELEGPLRGYLTDCQALSHGRTKAWDLASLLIKPVQRCLKYPLLLRQILSGTPVDHPNRADLEDAHSKMLTVAEHINQAKKRSDLVGKIVNKSDAPRRDSNVSASAAFGRSVTKKLLRSSQKVKIAVGLGQQERDDMFDTLSALVDSTRSSVLRFSNEANDWSRNTRIALESQAAMVEGWIDLYAPMEGEGRTLGGGHERLCMFLDHVLGPVLDGPYQDLDNEVRRSLLLKTNHLLSLFENPRSVIAKRNDRLLDHARYQLKKHPADRRSSEEFLTLSAQLLEELPRFLGSVSRYFNIILAGFAAAQATYHAGVLDLWKPFADHWCSQIPEGAPGRVEDDFAREHRPVSQIMETLAVGLGIASFITSQDHTPKSGRSTPTSSFRRRPSNNSYTTSYYSASSAVSPTRSTFDHPTRLPLQRRTSNLSVTSTAPSCTSSNLNTDESSTPSTSQHNLPSTLEHENEHEGSPEPQRPSSSRSATFGGSLGKASETPLAAVPSSGAAYDAQLSRTVNEATRIVSRLSVYLEEDPYDGSAGSPVASGLAVPDTPRPSRLESTPEVVVLYVAEAMASSKAPDIKRAGYPVLSYEIGDQLFVEHEEADSAEGGAGWLLGRTNKGEFGWGRSEDFGMVEV